tara:strand:- start:473 stop:1063 length:591 start_codon:yes stop_codon:yes gene_type:complete
MNLNELITEVYTLTNRPDLVAETTSAVKAATLKAHKTDFYSKDIYETGIQFTESSYKQSLDYIALISNFRAFKYLRKADSFTDDEGVFFTVLTPEETVDSYGKNRTDVAYIAGRVLEIRSSTNFQYAYLGCYVAPIITNAGYSSWVADLCPFAIVYEACRVIFKSIGYDEQSNTFTRLLAEEYELLKMSGLTDVGY